MSSTSVTRFRLSKAQLQVLKDIVDGYILHHDPRPLAKVWMYHPEKRCYKDLYFRTFHVLVENELIHDPGVYHPVSRYELTSKGKELANLRPAKRKKR